MLNPIDVEIYKKWQKSPRAFVCDMWKLEVERDNTKFVKGKHITWQQDDILQAVEDAINNKKFRRIAVKSGHGIGKSTTLAWLILWFLFCYLDAQIPCTAPTENQMYDVLWKELAKWLKLMPLEIQSLYEWSNTYIRIKERPETWFARAKTARKEAPEALAGVHGDFVMFVIDEASGVPEEIFNTAEGALTNKDILVLMISNPTRLIGYFYEAFHKDGKNWQQLSFNSNESPIVDREFVQRISEKHGENSDEYKIRVMGDFPSEEGIDEKGFVNLFTTDEIKFTQETNFVRTRMGIDPSGEGQDETAWAVRDEFKGGIVGTERTSNPKSIAEKTLTLMEKYKSDAKDIFIDNFGVGANVSQEIALTPFQYKTNGINVGEKGKDELYLNIRAEAYYSIKSWFRKGGSLIDDTFGHQLKEELLQVKFKRNLQGKIQIMSKDEMRKQGIPSPNKADAFMLTFTNIKPINQYAQIYIPGQMQVNPQHRYNQPMEVAKAPEAQVFYPRL
jgi:hypothetical protein